MLIRGYYILSIISYLKEKKVNGKIDMTELCELIFVQSDIRAKGFMETMGLEKVIKQTCLNHTGVLQDP